MAKKKAATKKRSTKSKANKKTINKAQAIRNFAKSKPSAGPTAISKALAAKGVKVTPAQVSTTLSNAKRNGNKKPAKVKALKPSTKRGKASADSVSVSQLLATQKFIREVGTIDAARNLINVVAKLQDS